MAASESSPFLPQGSVCDRETGVSINLQHLISTRNTPYFAFATKLDDRLAAHDGCGVVSFPEMDRVVVADVS